MEKLRIVFMGTPEFAVGILDHIHKNNYEIVGVITAADKPAGRGKQLKFSAVKEYALANNLRLMQPANLKDSEFLSELESLNANVQVVVAFRMLPEAVWRMPKLGTFNLHASLLPQYRGAAPINWAIINGDSHTGVTTFFIDDKIDTGEIILKSSTAISETENAGQLHDRLLELGKITVVDTLKLIEDGAVVTTKQENATEYKEAPKLNKDNCKIDWSKPAFEIYNLVRGLSPYPAAWCIFTDENQQWNVKIYECNAQIESHSFTAGTIQSTKKSIRIATPDGFIEVTKLQLPGKKVMLANELLNGMIFSQSAVAS